MKYSYGIELDYRIAEGGLHTGVCSKILLQYALFLSFHGAGCRASNRIAYADGAPSASTRNPFAK